MMKESYDLARRTLKPATFVTEQVNDTVNSEQNSDTDENEASAESEGESVHGNAIPDEVTRRAPADLRDDPRFHEFRPMPLAANTRTIS